MVVEDVNVEVVVIDADVVVFLFIIFLVAAVFEPEEAIDVVDEDVDDADFNDVEWCIECGKPGHRLSSFFIIINHSYC